MYLVKLTKIPKINDLRNDFFPRRFRYKRDAEELKAEVIHKGGDAVIEKISKNKIKSS